MRLVLVAKTPWWECPLMPPWCGLLGASGVPWGTRSIRPQLAAAGFRPFALLLTVAGGLPAGDKGRLWI